VLVAAAIAALGLAACGRKGGLDLPPSDTPAPAANNAEPNRNPGSSLMPGPSFLSGPPAAPAQNAQANPAPPPGPKKSFILDPILQ